MAFNHNIAVEEAQLMRQPRFLRQENHREIENATEVAETFGHRSAPHLRGLIELATLRGTIPLNNGQELMSRHPMLTAPGSRGRSGYAPASQWTSQMVRKSKYRITTGSNQIKTVRPPVL